MALEKFRRFISQERQIRISIEGAYGSCFQGLFESQLGSFPKYDILKNRYYKFSRKITKIAINVSQINFCHDKMPRK